MGVKLILSILSVVGLLLIVSCTSEPQVNPSVPAIYIIGDSQVTEEPLVQTFVVGEEDSSSWFKETKEKRHELNMIRYTEEYEDELEEFEFKSRLSNVRRTVDNELIIGYDKKLDNPRWEEVNY